MELAAILVALVGFTGVIWTLDRFYWAPRRMMVIANIPEDAVDEVKEAAEYIPAWIDLPSSLFPIFLVVLLLRSFLAEPFRIPSNSMMPTLLTGDFILVNKFSYGLRWPVLNTKFLDIGSPQHGDVVVFRYPKDPSIPYIKRVIGLPGDKIEYNHVHKTLYINGELIGKDLEGAYQGVGQGSPMTGFDLYEETLPEDVKHHILLRPGTGVSPNVATPSGAAICFWSNEQQKMSYIHSRAELREQGNPNLNVLKIDKIPEGHYLVFGDNRDKSSDSRFWGLVPEENLVGKAFLIWMNWDWSNGGVNFPRLGSAIK